MVKFEPGAWYPLERWLNALERIGMPAAFAASIASAGPLSGCERSKKASGAWGPGWSATGHAPYGRIGPSCDQHAACQAAVEAIPLRVGHWMGREMPLPQPALTVGPTGGL